MIQWIIVAIIIAAAILWIIRKLTRRSNRPNCPGCQNPSCPHRQRKC